MPAKFKTLLAPVLNSIGRFATTLVLLDKMDMSGMFNHKGGENSIMSQRKGVS
jgi:hypothetical protein